MTYLSNQLALKRLMQDRTSSYVNPDLHPRCPTWAQLNAKPNWYFPEEDIQLTGTSWLIDQKRAILGDIQGQGKTKQVLDAFDYLVQYDDNVRSMLIVCKASNVDDPWLSDIKKFIPGIAKVVDYRGTPAQRKKMFNLGADVAWAQASLIWIVSYAVYRLDYKLLAACPWDIVVLDESPYIGGTYLNDNMSQIGERIHAVKQPNQRRWLLSGTPIKKNAGSLWNQLRFLDLEPRSWTKFEHDILEVKEVSVTNTTTRKKITGVKSDAAFGQLNQVLSKCTLRRTDRSHLPPKLPTRYIDVPLSPADCKRYLNAAHNLRQCEAAIRSGKFAMPDQWKFNMRLLCSNNRNKILAVQEIVESAIETGDKCIVFTSNVPTLRSLYVDLKKYGLAYVLGSVSTSKDADGTSERSRMLDKFRDDPECKVLIITTGTGGEGIPLQAGNHVIFIDRPDSKALFDQCLSRPYRLGLEKPLYSYVLLATVDGKQTIEHSLSGTYTREGRVTEQVGLSQ